MARHEILHGDFDWYHRRFQHDDAKLTCSCGNKKTPEHIALCPLAHRTIRHWPRSPSRPTLRLEALQYLWLLEPGEFAQLLETTGFYTRICTRRSMH